jgi:crotonobetainyl-CoA:carnitine CoA-transferase CaiB-like acyl-CoA transferase
VYRDHPEVGKRQHAGIPWRMSETKCEVRSAAPCLGQHTEEVMTKMLGYSKAEYDEMKSKGALD